MLRELSSLGIHGEGLAAGGAGARTPPPWLQRMQLELGDQGPGDGVVALRTAGSLRGAHAAGHARAGGLEKRSQEWAPRRHLALGAAGRGRTDGQTSAFTQ